LKGQLKFRQVEYGPYHDIIRDGIVRNHYPFAVLNIPFSFEKSDQPKKPQIRGFQLWYPALISVVTL
jgi:hypothetical protein